ncbi:hypothetical protein P7K49_007286 [Saguinus oedipus]|uniref:Uncharacterized protein n=1 Tax=Saguinus oedipus TaxID=9490 RepID=A0ABQ9VV00_SAGOE|nr:hypothetical protein P7K49_007286 [Saguinus oedipus]
MSSEVFWKHYTVFLAVDPNALELQTNPDATSPDCPKSVDFPAVLWPEAFSLHTKPGLPENGSAKFKYGRFSEVFCKIKAHSHHLRGRC